MFALRGSHLHLFAVDAPLLGSSVLRPARRSSPIRRICSLSSSASFSPHSRLRIPNAPRSTAAQDGTYLLFAICYLLFGCRGRPRPIPGSFTSSQSIPAPTTEWSPPSRG
ncbi:uncharacterized protein LOC121987219 [Zingiber officinale]|uniref:uncharacterized protein LOC121987219 n=1 Tax=Zingiber officinale TaxID=94328 RepID=UPI001C4BEA2D|nr:uncharacterized protein LOC121987219 [Zingiber officinale]